MFDSKSLMKPSKSCSRKHFYLISKSLENRDRQQRQVWFDIVLIYFLLTNNQWYEVALLQYFHIILLHTCCTFSPTCMSYSPCHFRSNDSLWFNKRVYRKEITRVKSFVKVYCKTLLHTAVYQVCYKAMGITLHTVKITK